MKTSTAPQQKSQQLKETSNASAQHSVRSKSTTPHLDHSSIATELKRITISNINIAKKSNNLAAIKEAQRNNESLMQLADWHQEKANNQQAQLNLSELHKAAQNTLIKTS